MKKIDFNKTNIFWNFENVKLKDFGLIPEKSFISAPDCLYERGEEYYINLKDEDEVLAFIYDLAVEFDEGTCGVFAITDKADVLMAINTLDDVLLYTVKDAGLEYDKIGSIFYDLGLDAFGILVNTDNGYKVVDR